MRLSAYALGVFEESLM